MDLPHTREYFLSFFYSLNLDPQIKFRSGSFETVRTLVGNGLGYALVNVVPHTRTTYDGSEVITIPLAEKLRPLKIVMISLRRVPQRRVVRTFAEFARGYMLNWRERNNVTLDGADSQRCCAGLRDGRIYLEPCAFGRNRCLR